MVTGIGNTDLTPNGNCIKCQKYKNSNFLYAFIFVCQYLFSFIQFICNIDELQKVSSKPKYIDLVSFNLKFMFYAKWTSIILNILRRLLSTNSIKYP